MCPTASSSVSTQGVCLREGNHQFATSTPVTLHLLDTHHDRHTVRAGYDTCHTENGAVIASCRIEAPTGSVFCVQDRWRFGFETVQALLERSVTVEHVSGKELGFATEWILRQTQCATLPECDVWMPGAWYRQNEGVVSTAFGASLTDRDHLLRETRVALPYVQLCSRTDYTSLTLCVLGPSPSTGIHEDSSDTLISRELQYGSIGIDAAGSPGVRFCFPGTEGERNYLDAKKVWAYRYHPVEKDVRHSYQLALHTAQYRDHHEAMRQEWRHWFDHFQPALHPADLQKVYDAGADLLDVYCQRYNGAMGLPFWCTVPQGTVCDLSYQMGFVGQQPMCAYHLMRSGVENADEQRIDKGIAIVDFWVDRSGEEGVLPRVWYDVFPPVFKQDYPTYTRTVADGMEGILVCFQYLRRERGSAPERWLRFVTRFGQWLCAHQNADGSFYRAYQPDGTPVHTGRHNTSNVVRLLCNLFWETGDPAYRAAAVRAGEFCYQSCYAPASYIGGTADNDNTIDKEAGMLALYAFLALYDLTGEARWIQAAQGAADFVETWVYCRTFDVKPAKGNAVFDKVDITGLSLIATGHSHADVMMGYCAFDLYRLYLLTKDEHYLVFARFLLHNARQTMDWSGALGHAYPGLVEESGELARQYHNGLGRWLPWCTIAEIEALSRLKEWFGDMDIDHLEKRHEEMLLLNRSHGSSFLFLPDPPASNAASPSGLSSPLPRSETPEKSGSPAGRCDEATK